MGIDFSTFPSQLINGLSIGSVYALVAIGYTMVYGIVKLINFAHGDVIMVGSYIVFFMMLKGMPFWLSLLIALIVCGLLGVTIEKVAYKPLRKAPSLAVLITAIGVSLLLQNIFMLIFGSQAKDFPMTLSGNLKLGTVEVSYNSVVTIAVTIVLMITLTLFIKKTKIGKAMRAVSEDSGAATLMGINVNNTISFTFALGSMLAVIGGVLYSMNYTRINPFMGSMFGLKAFIAAVVGGIGIVPGAMLGGILMGIAESMAKGYISSQLSDTIVFSILILILLFKPSGILGKNIKEKV